MSGRTRRNTILSRIGRDGVRLRFSFECRFRRRAAQQVFQLCAADSGSVGRAPAARVIEGKAFRIAPDVGERHGFGER